ncbi:hypothetical protein M406DRAFT_287447 [Cryphonectria parasitica EP155]|uniref:Rhodopsin domain-containing protein n=1 Tax=Cryphonectria parasitica (strain ATCC 38755 / EP155) TaxID=660469 RepID=A0A9P4Y991_CRYP1|nr:uncharacterized protein M406DRAFT_287447 [Cryphonectria parasitica EP155]KAF3769314.1 hypothetical protein M406DRAFT_287447 [Cryphonectria parasitica EP155]
MESIMISPRDDDDVIYYNPSRQIYAGLWTLFAGATVFLSLRLWCKLTRRHGLWYDDYILISAYLFLMTTDIIITVEYATGYSLGSWNDRMHILINTSSIGTVIGQAVSKSAFGVTLLRMVEKKWQAGILWFCIVSMDSIAFSKCIFQWAKLCGDDDYQQWYRLQGWCLNEDFSDQWKEIGNIYNILMDFVFAMFPWFITWRLKLQRAEKVALCLTLSLGIIVAIITAVRTWWKDTPLMHVHDTWYMWRDAMSEIWYSGEVAGTIIVQCIPVLRPFVKDLHTSLTSRRLDATEPTTKGSNNWRGSTLVEKKGFASMSRDEENQKSPGIFELTEIPEEVQPPASMARSGGGYYHHQMGHHTDAYWSPSEIDLRIQATHTKPLKKESWPL